MSVVSSFSHARPEVGYLPETSLAGGLFEFFEMSRNELAAAGYIHKYYTFYNFCNCCLLLCCLYQGHLTPVCVWMCVDEKLCIATPHCCHTFVFLSAAGFVHSYILYMSVRKKLSALFPAKPNNRPGFLVTMAHW